MSDSNMPVYDQIGKGYDSTRKADPYLADRIALHLQIGRAAEYLDLACGTGNYTINLQEKHGGNWTGVDSSSRMITAAQEKSASIDWLVADCSSLPLTSNRFRGVICTLAIHHFVSLNLVFSEVSRTLNSGRFVILTATPEQMRHYWLCEYFPQALLDSIRQMPTLDAVSTALNQAGMDVLYTEPYDIQEDLQDFFLYSGKYKPAMYLDPNVRAGISTFALLANRAEVEQGCEQLLADIENGRIAQIQSAYAHNDGDYLFVVAGKV